MEAAIAWLVQTILATLLMDKMVEWIQQVGFGHEVERLQSEVERVEMVVAAVKGRAAGNRPLSRALTRLKELLYDADDIVDELDYYRLQQEVEGATVGDPEGIDPSRGNSDIPTSSRGGKKRRSKAWENFDVTEEDDSEKPVKARCKHCLTEVKCPTMNGTSGMRNHTKVCKKKPAGPNGHPPNPSSTGDATANVTSFLVCDLSGRKRKRTNEEPAQISAANTDTPWHKAELSNRMQQITDQLQNIRGEVSEVLKLYGLCSASSLNHSASTTANQHPRISSLAPRKVYGRVVERNYIIKLITENKSDGVTVLPIVGIAGVGKTALTQLVYNDPDVKSLFDHRIWVLVSHNFDEIRLTMEMLSFVSSERHEGINCFARLQEILKSHVKSKKVLLILDDVWDDKNDCQWKQLVAPFKSDSSNNNVILVTTRKSSVAKMIGTAGPINLGALKNDDFWLLFKSCAFDDGNHEGPTNLSTVGRKIADKLKGNPLAAITTGRLLRDDLTIGHWSNILKKESWKSLGLSGGIMSALKLSYDELPYHLQQCFSYCSIFPEKYMFLGKDLVYIWISQGFVHCTHLNKRPEETGWEYLNDLVNMGFFQKVEEQEEEDENEDGEEESSLGSQIWYSMCGLMHDFARMVSRAEYATIDGLQSDKMLPTIHHLSIVTDSAYNKDWHGNIPRNKKFEENLRNIVTSVSKLRTLVLLGHYDSFFIELFQDIFRKAHNLRLLQVSATFTGFNSFQCGLTNSLHLRYLKLKLYGVVPQFLSKSFHLQVLDVDSDMDIFAPNGLHNLISLRHLVAHKGVHSSIARIGNMTSIQELHDFGVQISCGFEITQLQSMSELVQIGLSQLHYVKSREEAYGAGLRNKEHLEKLHLSWKDTLSDQKYVIGTSSESSVHIAREVLEGLEPHMDLKHLHISGYDGTTSPTWLANNLSVTSLQTLHLDDCGGWRILPSLESLPFLAKLKLSRMWEVIEILVPSVEELVLIKMPKLVRCSSTSIGGLSSSLRALQIEKCRALKVFDLFENDDNFEIMQWSWLTNLRNLILRYCPHFKVLKPLPPSITFYKLLISGVSILPSMKGSASEKLCIGYFDEDYYGSFDKSSDELRILDDKILMFHNLRNLKSMVIRGCRNLRSISFKGFSYLVSLTSLEIRECEKLFSSDEMPEHTHEDVPAANCNAFPSLESLRIVSCGIAGKWLSRMLHHAPCLVVFYLCTEEGTYDKANVRWLLPESLQELNIRFYSLETLQPCFRSDITSLKKLEIYWSRGLQSLQLHSCTALEELTIESCESLTTLEGLQSLGSLRHLYVCNCELLTAIEGLQFLGRLRSLTVLGCPGLPPCLETFSRQGYKLFPRLDELHVDDPSFLTTPFCKHLTSLQRICLQDYSEEMTRLTDEQERALVLLKSLQELEFSECYALVDLPEGLHTLPSLKKLRIHDCSAISVLPETHLPLSLEELEIDRCSKELADGCRLLEPSKQKVKIARCP